MGYLMSGTSIRDKRTLLLEGQFSALPTKPKLVIIQVGDVLESSTYIRQKKNFGEKIGVLVEHVKIKENTKEGDVVEIIRRHNEDKNTHGIIVQLPLPIGMDSSRIIDTISPVKDVDGLTSTNVAFLLRNSHEGHIPATTRGILTLLSEYDISLVGKKVVIVGRSMLVGKPTAMAMIGRDATVTVCHSKTVNLAFHTRSADVLIVAAGQPKIIAKEHVSSGQVIVDVGINVMDINVGGDGRRTLSGDVDTESVLPIVTAVSPVPGGVGPLTVLSLFENLFDAYNRQIPR